MSGTAKLTLDDINYFRREIRSEEFRDGAVDALCDYAERYLWLRGIEAWRFAGLQWRGAIRLSADEMDAAIDAAMGKK